MKTPFSFLTLVCFLLSSVIGPLPTARAEEFRLPAPGVMVHLSSEFTPAHLKGITIHPDNALMFDFIIQRGDEKLSDQQKREEYKRLIKYFLASLAVPDEDQWVNLSPYEKNRIIKDDFGKTEMGRDLLAQDYILKQLTASLIYPEDNLGKKFWDKVYAQAQQQYGTTNIPVNTFNKVWIVPDDALIYEKGNTAYVVRNHLKVMLEEDYLSLEKHNGQTVIPAKAGIRDTKAHAIGSQAVREIVLPALEKEVNEGRNFSSLRQVYSGMILAAWYKRVLKESLLGKIYANKAKVKGVDQDPKNNQEIYQRYVQAYKKGVFNYIKEDMDKLTNQSIPRKYFSGGVVSYDDPTHGVNFAQVVSITHNSSLGDLAMNSDIAGNGGQDIVRAKAAEYRDKAMNISVEAWKNITTDPREHNPNYFKYIVHSIQSESLRLHRDILEIQLKLNGLDVDENRRTDLLRNSDDIAKKAVISTSLIDQNHRGTWGNVGFILDVPAENILSVSNQDMGSLPRSAEYVKARLRERDIESPDVLLKNTHPSQYNELEITGTNPFDLSKKVKVIGVFIKVGPDGKPQENDANLLGKIRGIAGTYNLPIIDIPIIYNDYVDRKIHPTFAGIDGEVVNRIHMAKSGYSYSIYRDAKGVISGLVVFHGGQSSRWITEQDFDIFTTAILEELKMGRSSNLAEAFHRIFPQGVDKAKEELRSQWKRGKAMVGNNNPLGGIDLNAANLNLQIKRDGKGVPLPLAQQDMAQLVNIQGFVPIILEIKPAVASGAPP